MNILGRNLLSLTVYHLRAVARKVFGGPVISSISCVGDDLVVEGTGGRLGETIVISLPGLPVGLGVVGTGGVWSVVFEGECSEDLPNPEDIIVDQTPTPEPPKTPGVGVKPNPDGDGVIVEGDGGEPGDVVEVELPDGSVGEGEVDEDGNWEVEIPGVDPDDIDPDDIVVIIKPPPAEPEIEDILCTFDSASIDGLGVGRGDTVIVTFPDGQVVETVADDEGRWAVSVMTETCPLVDELEIEVIPNPENIIIRPVDGVLCEIAGYEFLECTDDGQYIAYEMGEQGDGGDGGSGRRIASISSDFVQLELPERHSDLIYSQSPHTSFYKGKYYIAGDQKMVIIESVDDFISESEVVVSTGLYLYEYGGLIYKGKSAAYFIVKEAESDVDPTLVYKLIRHDLTDTEIRLELEEGVGFRYSRYHFSQFDGKDWFFRTDFYESYLIDGNRVEAGPLFDFRLGSYEHGKSKLEWISDDQFIAVTPDENNFLNTNVIYNKNGTIVESFGNAGYSSVLKHDGYVYYSRDGYTKKLKNGVEQDTQIYIGSSTRLISLENAVVDFSWGYNIYYYIDEQRIGNLPWEYTNAGNIDASPDYLIFSQLNRGIYLYPLIYEN